nr:MAG TPA: hypothetical protein [Caudoviricetes sp.]
MTVSYTGQFLSSAKPKGLRNIKRGIKSSSLFFCLIKIFLYLCVY